MNAALRSSTKHGFAVSSNRKEAATGGSRRLLPALLALGGTCGLAGGPASALELGPIDVQSTLGKPLRASISYALNPQEAIHDYCIYLRPGRTASGLPSIDRASVALSNGTILLSGREALREPLLSLQLAVDCPGAAQLTREYSIFLSPWMPSTQAEPTAGLPTASAQNVPATAVSRTSTQTVTATAVPATTSTRPAPTAPLPAPATSLGNIDNAREAANAPFTDRTPLARATSYRVQQGDTLSGVAQRISDRTVGIWQAVDVIFAANPDAFIDSDRDLLKAGALLHIPASLRAAENNQSTARSISAQVAPSFPPAIDRVSSSNDEAPPVQTGATAFESAGPFVAPVETSDRSRTGASSFEPAVEVIPETAIEQPATAIEQPATTIEQPATEPSTTGDRRDGAANGSGFWSWLIWLGGSGVALMLALLLFGRTLRSRFGGNADPIADETDPNRRNTDDARSDDEVARHTAAGAHVDFSFGEAAPEGRAIPLDGDLDAGTGFQDGGEIDIAQDFGFSASGDPGPGLDLKFPDESAVRLEDDETAMLVTGQPPEEPIIVNEVPPDDEEPGDNDLSMLLDAMRHSVGDSDETTKDVQALELDANDAGQADDNSYTLNQEIDYKILEQDYEDELTSTQALNAELAQAALELRVDVDERNATRNEDDGVNEQMTSEMPAAENDATAAIDIESAALDAKKPKAKKTGT